MKRHLLALSFATFAQVACTTACEIQLNQCQQRNVSTCSSACSRSRSHTCQRDCIQARCGDGGNCRTGCNAEYARCMARP
jgi:hypothetical protein